MSGLIGETSRDWLQTQIEDLISDDIKRELFETWYADEIFNSNMEYKACRKWVQNKLTSKIFNHYYNITLESKKENNELIKKYYNLKHQLKSKK
tara:strand:- start:620 stop:901 length:282 start_codon:yes stop_codon:yes gene_type:complete